jgi:hypothetical protein
MAPLSKTAQVLKYFAQQYGGPKRKGIPRKRLVKMAFMCDLLSREYTGTPITDLKYYRYTYGPYDRAVEEFATELEVTQHARTKVEWDGDTEIKRLVDLGLPISFEFSPEELEIVRYVAKNYLEMPMKELLDDVVYLTAPMLHEEAEGERLKMDLVNDTGTKAVGFSLSDVLQAERDIDAGHFVTDF